MATMDIFEGDAFTIIELTRALENIPFKPALLSGANIFSPRGVRARTVMIESRDGTLSLIPFSERGSAYEQQVPDRREMRAFICRQFKKQDVLWASEIQSVRDFGSETATQQVQTEVAHRLRKLRQDAEATFEYHLLNGIQGIVKDPRDNATVVNYFTEFAIAPAAEIDFDLDNATPASGALRKRCQALIESVEESMGGLAAGAVQVRAECGSAFFADLVSHKEVRETYLNTAAAADLRGRIADEVSFGGITFRRYRGGAGFGVPTDKAFFYPDRRRWILAIRNGDQVFTIPNRTDVPWQNGTEIVFFHNGSSGIKTITGAAGVFINSVDGGSVTIDTRYDAWLLKHRSKNQWFAVPWKRDPPVEPVKKTLVIAASDETTALTTGTKVTFRMPYAMTLNAVRASLATAQSAGSLLTVDIKEEGTSIFATKITIDNTDANTQVYWDEIFARLNRKAGTHTCILSLNGASTAGWTNVVNTLITATVASSTTGGNAWGYDPGLRWGTGATATGHAYCSQSLPSGWHSAIDAGAVILEANFQLACTTSTPQASGRAYVEFYDAGSSQLGSRVYSDPAETSPARQGARRKQFSTPVPANARSIRFGIMGTRVSGTSLNAIFASFSYINIFLER